MHQHRAVVLALLMLTSSIVLLVDNEDVDVILEENDNVYALLDAGIPSFPSPGNPWIEESLNIRVESGVEKVRVTVITWSLAELNYWQLNNNALDKQADAKNGEIFEVYDPTSGEIDHRTFWMAADIFHKLSSVPGVISILDAQNNPQPCLLYTSPSPRDRQKSRMPSSA